MFYLDCYWVGSLDFNFFWKSWFFPLSPQKVNFLQGGQRQPSYDGNPIWVQLDPSLMQASLVVVSLHSLQNGLGIDPVCMPNVDSGLLLAARIVSMLVSGIPSQKQTCTGAPVEGGPPGTPVQVHVSGYMTRNGCCKPNYVPQ